jgi:hypothetical protein
MSGCFPRPAASTSGIHGKSCEPLCAKRIQLEGRHGVLLYWYQKYTGEGKLNRNRRRGIFLIVWLCCALLPSRAIGEGSQKKLSPTAEILKRTFLDPSSGIREGSPREWYDRAIWDLTPEQWQAALNELIEAYPEVAIRIAEGEAYRKKFLGQVQQDLDGLVENGKINLRRPFEIYASLQQFLSSRRKMAPVPPTEAMLRDFAEQETLRLEPRARVLSRDQWENDPIVRKVYSDQFERARWKQETIGVAPPNGGDKVAFDRWKKSIIDQNRETSVKATTRALQLLTEKFGYQLYVGKTDKKTYRYHDMRPISAADLQHLGFEIEQAPDSNSDKFVLRGLSEGYRVFLRQPNQKREYARSVEWPTSLDTSLPREFFSQDEEAALTYIKELESLTRSLGNINTQLDLTPYSPKHELLTERLTKEATGYKAQYNRNLGLTEHRFQGNIINQSPPLVPLVWWGALQDENRGMPPGSYWNNRRVMGTVSVWKPTLDDIIQRSYWKNLGKKGISGAVKGLILGGALLGAGNFAGNLGLFDYAAHLASEFGMTSPTGVERGDGVTNPTDKDLRGTYRIETLPGTPLSEVPLLFEKDRPSGTRTHDVTIDSSRPPAYKLVTRHAVSGEPIIPLPESADLVELHVTNVIGQELKEGIDYEVKQDFSGPPYIQLKNPLNRVSGINFQAGMAKKNFIPEPPHDPLLDDLNSTLLREINLELKDAGFTVLHDGLESMIEAHTQAGKPISVDDVIQIMKDTSYYSRVPEKPSKNLPKPNTFASVSGFEHANRACVACGPSRRITHLYLGRYYALLEKKDIDAGIHRVYPELIEGSVIARNPGQSDLIGENNHAVEYVQFPWRAGKRVLDATPYTPDPRNDQSRLPPIGDSSHQLRRRIVELEEEPEDKEPERPNLPAGPESHESLRKQLEQFLAFKETKKLLAVTGNAKTPAHGATQLAQAVLRYCDGSSTEIEMAEAIAPLVPSGYAVNLNDATSVNNAIRAAAQRQLDFLNKMKDRARTGAIPEGTPLSDEGYLASVETVLNEITRNHWKGSFAQTDTCSAAMARIVQPTGN